jgi:protein ImuB
MRRVVSLYLPTWPTDRLRRKGGGGNVNGSPPFSEPLVTAVRQGPRRVVASVDQASRRLGLRPGLTIAEAQARVPGLHVVEATPDEDAAALEALARWCLACTPLVSVNPPDGIWLDIAGSAHLFGGETALLGKLLARIEGQGFTVKAAVTYTPGAAWAVARFAPRGAEVVIPPGGSPNAIAEFPVRALRLAADTLDGLRQLGVERVGQLAAMPRAPLKLRFGEEVVRRLDQALGAQPELLTYIDPPETLLARLAFAEPISAPETLQRVTERLLVDLCSDLEGHDVGARLLDLVFARVDNQRQAVRVGTSRPTRQVRHLLRLFIERLTLVDPGHGIEEAVLLAPRVERLRPRQAIAAQLAGNDPDDANLSELVDRLGVSFGTQRLYRAAPVESELPERSVRRVSPLAPATGATWPKDLPRPAKLLDPPEAVHAVAVAPDNPPIFFVWRKRRYRVVRADGPEQVFGEWWVRYDEMSSSRDYYAVEDEQGARYWLFRDAPTASGGRWWLHGLGQT